MITGASDGYSDTFKAQDALKTIMTTKGLDALVVSKIESYISRVDKKVEDKKLKKEYAKSLDRYFIEFTNQVRSYNK